MTITLTVWCLQEFKCLITIPRAKRNLETNAATPSDLKPIYGANIQHQPVSKIMKNLRDALVVPDAARGLSIFGLDSFELLVEESTEDYARGVQNSLKIKTTDQREPLDFM